MKANKFLTLFFGMIAALAIVSCVQDDDFNIPSSFGDEENEKLEALIASSTVISIAEAKAMYEEGEFIDPVDTEIYIKGYVSSSDRTGNFFKEFFIQDSPTNPTTAIKVVLNLVDTYNKYNVGREVYVNLNGLYIGEERVGNGVITIGGGTETDQYGTTVTQLSSNQTQNKVLRSTVTEEMVPLEVSFSQISGAHVGLLVKVNGVEFEDSLEGERYFDSEQDFDTRRTLQACDGFDYSNFQLETSAFASFKYELLPTANGAITAVVNKTFDGASLVLALNDLDGVNFTDTRCSLLNIEDFSVVLEEDFESMPTGTTVSGNGWTAYAEEGNYNWRVLNSSDNQNNTNIASMGAYNSGTPVNIAWLISPAIDLDAQDLEFVSFESSNSFSDDSELELLISTDWDGNQANIATATWSALPGTIVGDSTHYQDWVGSGLISLSEYSGNVYIAFKYVGGDNSGSNAPSTGTIDGTFEIDNFRVLVEN
ncbi:hypothetical protein IA57_06335 [Mangrovimonas yunxiaonensis]|uniref:DUF5689 domain-containing protein n=1 Tax=Mangrovimonas yunxiaonensis TaxID=1197477 RepID=A0A084TL57_9FLAO|nr:DUF5689 domain-containing protein [Mangrovimonas yunxiaonensis]KFB01443.1 hypothetical protein IA57_06335 [Mangrovimonas yunxiaonensis]GGH36631.1 hypothetical protein GCM10011364_04060 [Mangrovimonas yunxiaonensis]